MTKSFNDKLSELLKKDPRFVDDESGELIGSEIVNEALKIDKKLIESLLSDKEIKKKFFIEIKTHWVFEVNKFIDYVEDKNFLSDSYTKFKNKIGLNINGKFLKERKEISLVWPFKDCVLEGGMTKEDEKRNEIFFNEILAQDEIDRLLDPKVLTNFKRYSTKGEEKVTDFKRDADGTIKENLIIKGNNLLALHSVNKVFQGRAKLIYIDPPYNTGSDSFKYNDNFNHSTWLTFMKNRLEIAKLLLRDNGLICVHLDHNELHYLKIIMDEVFGREHFINQIVWKRRGGSLNQPNCYGNVADYILIYSKTDEYDFTPQKSLDDDNTKKYIEERFIYKDKNGRRYMKSPLINPSYRPTMMYDYKGYKSPEKGWLVTKEKMEQFDKEGRLIFPEDKSQRISKKIFLDEYEGQPIDCIWTDIYVINPMAKESLDFDGQKPEKLIQRILETNTNKEDIVLDFFGGSGTTAATCHKMGRRYITIEQIDTQMETMLDRLHKVIGKENSKGKLHPVIENYDENGISKSVKWKGGGNFIYCELMKYNEKSIDKIKSAKSNKELLIIWKEMVEHYFLNYDVNVKKFNDNQEEFKKLSLDKQKKLLVEMVNKNQLYVNLSEIDDAQFKVSKEDKELNKKFYT